VRSNVFTVVLLKIPILRDVILCHRMSSDQNFRTVVPSSLASNMTLPMKAIHF